METTAGSAALIVRAQSPSSYAGGLTAAATGADEQAACRPRAAKAGTAA